MDALQLLGLGPVDDQLHQCPPKPDTLQVGTQQDGVFGLDTTGIRMEADGAGRFPAAFLDSDERHLPRVVELGQASEKGMAERFQRREKAQSQIF